MPPSSTSPSRLKKSVNMKMIQTRSEDCRDIRRETGIRSLGKRETNLWTIHRRSRMRCVAHDDNSISACHFWEHDARYLKFKWIGREDLIDLLWRDIEDCSVHLYDINHLDSEHFNQFGNLQKISNQTE